MFTLAGGGVPVPDPPGGDGQPQERDGPVLVRQDPGRQGQGAAKEEEGVGAGRTLVKMKKKTRLLT